MMAEWTARGYHAPLKDLQAKEEFHEIWEI